MIKNMLSGSDVAEFRAWMGWADRYVILTHMGPDGDAIGSSLALCHYLKSKGKQAVVVVPDSFPDFLKWLPGAGSIKVHSVDPDGADELVYKADVICCLDFNVVGRIDKVAVSFLYSKAKKFLLDHHPYPGANYDVTLSHPEASSTSEMVFHLICALGDFSCMDLDIARCIYTGIMTDTGALSYNSNSSTLFNVVSHLLEIGIDKDDIYRRVYNTYPPSATAPRPSASPSPAPRSATNGPASSSRKNNYLCNPFRGCVGIGRQPRLRIWWRKPWGFESPHPYEAT